MKKFYIILFIFCTTNLFGQEEEIKLLIIKEFSSLDQTFNDNVFINRSSTIDTSFFKLISMETFNIVHLDKKEQLRFLSCNIIKAKVVINSTYMNYKNYISNRIEKDTLTFYIVNRLLNYYKLFGFYNSDVQLFFYNLNEKESIQNFGRMLIKHNILTSEAAKLYIKAIKNNEEFIPSKVKKPSEILKYYFIVNSKKALTRLLPIEVLKPLSF